MRMSGITVNKGIIAIMAVSFLAFWMSQTAPIWEQLILVTTEVAAQPWTLLTYPLVSRFDLIGLIFSAYWLWSFGGQVESDLGSKKYAAVCGALIALGGLFMWLGSLLIRQPGFLAGFYTMIAAITVMWGTRNPNATIMLLILPIKGKWLAWLSAGLVFFGVTPLFAPFAALPCALAWAFADNRLPIPYGRPTASQGTRTWRRHPKEDKTYFEDVKRREIERDERERLRKLFERSMIEDKDE